MDVFISHSSAQKAWVEMLGRNLLSAGYEVFIDRWRMIPGEGWMQRLDQALEECDAAILVTTREALASGWVREEYEKLRSRKAHDVSFPLIPVILDGVEQDLPFVGSIHYVDFRAPRAYRDAFARLICGLTRREPGPEPTYDGELEIPDDTTTTEERATRIARAESLRSYSARVADEVTQRINSSSKFVTVVAPRRSALGDVADEIRSRVTPAMGAGAFLRLSLQLAEGIDAERVFWSGLMNQAVRQGYNGQDDLVSLLESMLGAGKSLYLCVEGLEHANGNHRKDFCIKLRKIAHDYSTIRVAFVGGERLHELRYGDGHESVLTGADVIFWPDPDVGRLIATEPSWGGLGAGMQDAIIRAAGGSAELARELLRECADSASPDDVESHVGVSVWLYASLVPLIRLETVRSRIAQLATESVIRKWQPYFANEVVRRLFWSGLARRDGPNLVWRSDAVRKGALACVGEFS